ncbi:MULTISPECIES: LysR family transcriptional regulator [Paraburkholderia]|uniref:LysR family transcriptional regulator n=1 Tax=Paraburkholderia madseniana TaxID=2599607 RepID=A0AAP5EX38_9BURK|nr:MULTISPECIES: LysR family transcriptional regulator [Paraburkholderia]MCX4148752.1 LysR family transcriptional regulator [Paraburkholderia madseniana]MDN7151690.1 LysR family transcriptional regulator [Paraburkholderia sp. WS6]MDQ6410570.1 LysR family transcriptional regulator [Paraburkholderia madseniana]
MIQPQSLRYFAEVARTGSLRHASETFFVAPSAIGKQISNLEKELGAALFDRSPRGATLTAAGQLLLDYVNANTSHVEQLRAAMDDLSSLRHGVVRIALVEAAVHSFMPDLITEFSRDHPGIAVHLEVCGTAQIVDALVDHRAEIGMAFNVLNRDDINLHGRSIQPLQMICRPEHPLASRKTVSMSELGNMIVALPARTFGIRYLIEKAAARANVALQVAVEANSLQVIKNLVRQSDLVSFMPPLTLEQETSHGWLRAVPLDERDSGSATIDVISFRGRQLSVAAQRFLDLLIRRLRTGRQFP